MIFHLISSSLWFVIPLSLVAILIGWHFTSLCSSLYLHRSITHKGVIFAPIVSFLMRLWLWLATGINTRQWVACHRKHHASPDQPEDPHSPVQKGKWHVVFLGWLLYRKAVSDPKMIEQFGYSCPDDWLERHVFSERRLLGLISLAFICALLFGWIPGAIIWLMQITWMPIIGGIINGLGHSIGYRNKETHDHSTNILKKGIIIAGEELHNNHHAYAASPKFSRLPGEFDLGYWYIDKLEKMGLAEVRYSITK